MTEKNATSTADPTLRFLEFLFADGGGLIEVRAIEADGPARKSFHTTVSNAAQKASFLSRQSQRLRRKIGRVSDRRATSS